MLMSEANRIDHVAIFSNGAIRLRLISPYNGTKVCLQASRFDGRSAVLGTTEMAR
jgi:hypothetical protein